MPRWDSMCKKFIRRNTCERKWSERQERLGELSGSKWRRAGRKRLSRSILNCHAFISKESLAKPSCSPSAKFAHWKILDLLGIGLPNNDTGLTHRLEAAGGKPRPTRCRIANAAVEALGQLRSLQSQRPVLMVTSVIQCKSLANYILLLQ